MRPCEMNDPKGHLPRRYFVDDNGRRILIGLTTEETFEFETLDSQPALDEAGHHVDWAENGVPMPDREKRWLELYNKHETAWRQWMAKTSADRLENLTFMN